MAANVLQTNILLGGKLLGNFRSTFKTAESSLSSLRAHALKTNAAFSGMGKTLIAGAAGFFAIDSLKNFASESMKLSKAQAGTRAAALSLIQHQNALRGIGLAQSQQEFEALERQAKAMQEMTGFSKEIYMHGAATLKQFKLSTAQTEQMQKAMGDLMAFQRRMGIDTAEDYTTIGKAIEGQAKALKTLGISFTSGQQRQFKMLTDAGKAQMIFAEIERQHGGEAAARMKDRFGAGQMDLIASHWKETMTAIGDNLIPVQRRMIDFFGQVGEVFGPKLIEASRIFRGYMEDLIPTFGKLIPQMREWVSKGWNTLMVAFKWFKDNWGWLKEVVKWWLIWKTAVLAFGIALGPVITAMWAFTGIMAVFDVIAAANPFGLMAVGAGALALAAWAVIANWTKVKEFFIGTDLTHGKGFLKALPKNVQRAQPAFPTKGLLNEEWFNNKDSLLSKMMRTDWVQKWKEIWKGFTDWLATMKKIWEGFKNWNDVILQQTISYLQIILGLMGRIFSPTSPTNSKGQTPNSLDPYRPGGPLGPPAPKYNIPRMIRRPGVVPQSGLNLTHFGYAGDSTPDWRSSHGIGAYSPKMWSMKSGYSAALLKADADAWGIKPNQTFNYQGKQYRRDDLIPSRWKDKQGVWHTMSRGRIDVYDPGYREGKTASSNQSGNGGVHLEYHDHSTIHVHGGDEKAVAAARSRHIHNLKKSLAEAEYMRNRQRFT